MIRRCNKHVDGPSGNRKTVITGFSLSAVGVVYLLTVSDVSAISRLKPSGSVSQSLSESIFKTGLFSMPMLIPTLNGIDCAFYNEMFNEINGVSFWFRYPEIVWDSDAFL